VGNLTARIFLSLGRMSTVKIRAGSLFCTSHSRIGAGGAGSGAGHTLEKEVPGDPRRQNPSGERFFLTPPQTRTALHSLYTGFWSFPLAGSWYPGAKSENTISEGLKKKIDVDQNTVRSLSAV